MYVLKGNKVYMMMMIPFIFAVYHQNITKSFLAATDIATYATRPAV